ncbi:hypothetical protein COP2_024376 [Malus domestica]
MKGSKEVAMASSNAGCRGSGSGSRRELLSQEDAKLKCRHQFTENVCTVNNHNQTKQKTTASFTLENATSKKPPTFANFSTLEIMLAIPTEHIR